MMDSDRLVNRDTFARIVGIEVPTFEGSRYLGISQLRIGAHGQEIDRGRGEADVRTVGGGCVGDCDLRSRVKSAVLKRDLGSGRSSGTGDKGFACEGIRGIELKSYIAIQCMHDQNVICPQGGGSCRANAIQINRIT